MAKHKTIPEGEINVPVIDRRVRYMDKKPNLDETEKEQKEAGRIHNLENKGTPTEELIKTQKKNVVDKFEKKKKKLKNPEWYK